MNQRIRNIKELLNEVKVLKNLKKYNYFPKSPDELYKIILEKHKNFNYDFNDINTSQLYELIKFGDVFRKQNFLVDEWDVSRVRSFKYVFAFVVEFNSDLSNWDVSNGVDFSNMFYNCFKFNQNINSFDFRNAEKMNHFFHFCSSFNKEVYNFNFNEKVKKLTSFFLGCKNFNQDVSMWDVSNVENFDFMFENTKKFKQNLTNWNVLNAKYWDDVFKGSLMEKHTELMPEKFREDYV